MSEVCQSCTEFFGSDHFATGEAFTHKLDVELVSGMCQQSRIAERNRIVSLLQADICPDWTVYCCEGFCRAYTDAIILINRAY